MKNKITLCATLFIAQLAHASTSELVNLTPFNVTVQANYAGIDPQPKKVAPNGTYKNSKRLNSKGISIKSIELFGTTLLSEQELKKGNKKFGEKFRGVGRIQGSKYYLIANLRMELISIGGRAATRVPTKVKFYLYRVPKTLAPGGMIRESDWINLITGRGNLTIFR